MVIKYTDFEYEIVNKRISMFVVYTLENIVIYFCDHMRQASKYKHSSKVSFVIRIVIGMYVVPEGSLLRHEPQSVFL